MPESRRACSSRCSVRASTAASSPELARELVEVEVVHAGAVVRLRELLGQLVEVGDVLEDTRAVAEPEPFLAVHPLRAPPVLAGPQRLEVAVEPGERRISSGEPNACWASASSSSRCSWVIELRIRCAAAARCAKASSSSSMVRGFSGKNSPCLAMNSSNCSWVSSPRLCASSSVLRSSSISLIAARSSSVAFSSASFMPAKRWSSISRPSRSLIFSKSSRASLALPVVVAQLADRGRRRRRQVVELHLGERAVALVHVDIARQLLALLEDRPVEQLLDLLQRAVEVVSLGQLASSLRDPTRQVVETGLVPAAAPQELPHRPLGRVAGHDVLADRVQRLGQVDRRRERVGPVDVLAVAGAAREPAVGSSHRSSRRRRSPC